MFIVFRKYKCPICGSFGKEMEKNIFKCRRCEVSFNHYSVIGIKSLEITRNNFYWN